MSILSQFLTAEEVAKLSDSQVVALSDQLDGLLTRELFNNQQLHKTLKDGLAPAHKALGIK